MKSGTISVTKIFLNPFFWHFDGHREGIEAD